MNMSRARVKSLVVVYLVPAMSTFAPALAASALVSRFTPPSTARYLQYVVTKKRGVNSKNELSAGSGGE